MGTLSKMNRPEGIENKTKFKICHGCIQVPYCTSERYGVELDSTLIYVPYCVVRSCSDFCFKVFSVQF